LAGSQSTFGVVDFYSIYKPASGHEITSKWKVMGSVLAGKVSYITVTISLHVHPYFGQY
jgi:hypothetical protein